MPGLATFKEECEAVRALIRARDIRRAGPACESLVSRHPERAEAWAVFAELWGTLDEFEHAIECTEHARTLEPDVAIHAVNLARYEVLAGQHRQALERAEALLPDLDDDYLVLDTLGNVFSHVGEQMRALDLFERALELRPDDATALYNLATSYRFFGRVDEAEELFERVIERRSDDHEAVHSRSVLRRQTEAHNHLEDLRRRLDTPAHWIAACHYAYALGKEYDDLGRPADAFAAFARGAELMHRHRPSGIDQELAGLAAATRALAEDRLPATRDGEKTSEPVFVIGLPRTGSTLIERILARHSGVFAAGELSHFPRLARLHLGATSVTDAYARASARPDALDYRALGQAYLAATRPRTGHTAHFIDKLPRNDLWAGLIHRALPEARFILTRREPMDAGYALFRTLFRGGYAWTYSLEDIGRYLQAQARLMDAVKASLPAECWLEVAYEDLVADPERRARSMVEFLGLSWEDACLDFQNNPDAVVTASAHQVRQPVYTSSVGKWKQVAGELEPLARALK
jgi:tetratricopeptide (TPR) repeat protein